MAEKDSTEGFKREQRDFGLLFKSKTTNSCDIGESTTQKPPQLILLCFDVFHLISFSSNDNLSPSVMYNLHKFKLHLVTFIRIQWI